MKRRHVSIPRAAALAGAGLLTLLTAWRLHVAAATEPDRAARSVAARAAGETSMSTSASTATADATAGPRVQTDDKPLAPVRLLLLPGDVSGGTLPVTLQLQPVRVLSALRWQWELAGDVDLLQGPSEGSADGRAGAVTEAAVTLRVPAPGAYGSATLVATGVFSGADQDGPTGDETIVRSVSLTWGEAPSAVPVVVTTDAETGGTMEVAVVPSSHRAGR